MDRQAIIDTLRTQQEELEVLVVQAEEALETLTERHKAVTITVDAFENGIFKVKNGQEPKAIRNRAYVLLEQIGQPLHYTAIHKILVGMGTEIGGQNPATNLIAHLSGDKGLFKSLGEGMWGLAEWPEEVKLPPAPIAAPQQAPSSSTAPAITNLTPETIQAVIGSS